MSLSNFQSMIPKHKNSGTFVRFPFIKCVRFVVTLFIVAATCASLILFIALLFDQSSLIDQQGITFTWIHQANTPESPNYVEDGIHDLQYMHMGMIEKLANGSFATFFQSSQNVFEGTYGQSLYWSVSNDMGHTWDTPQVVVQSKDVPVWSPVAHVEAGRLWLFFSESSTHCQYYDKLKGLIRVSPGGTIFYIVSDDNGESWTFPMPILEYQDEHELGIPKVLANKLAVLSNGAWVLPFWREPGKTCPVERSTTDPLQWVNGSAGVLWSGNQGITWEVNGEIRAHETWLIENTIVEMRDSVLLQLFRTRQGVMYKDYSYDMGRTWTSPVETLVPNPNSKLHAISLPNGYLLCVYNHSANKRTPLTLAISKDQGVNWKVLVNIETDPDLQFAYPTMLRVNDKLIVVYSVMSKQTGTLHSIGMKAATLDINKLL